MVRDRDPAVSEWIEEAKSIGIVEAFERASGHGMTRLRRVGREMVGPCPTCGGSDRFAINPSKNVFICRGAAKGGPISLVMHIDGTDYLRSVETITGRPKPGGGRVESEQERQDREKRIATMKAEAAERDRVRMAKETARVARRRATAGGIWGEAIPITGTQAERYLAGRGIDMSRLETSQLRFHPELPHKDSPDLFPALIAKVTGQDGRASGIWQIYLGDGPKGRARLKDTKIGMGPMNGGAVRIGGIASKIGLAEGVESSAAAAEVDDFAMPVWPCLSTSGLIGFVPPPEVEEIVIFPDFDLPEQDPKTGKWRRPPGLSAARRLIENLADWPGVVSLIDRPAGLYDACDWVDVLRSIKGLADE
jgi:hypothetical protein